MKNTYPGTSIRLHPASHFLLQHQLALQAKSRAVKPVHTTSQSISTRSLRAFQLLSPDAWSHLSLLCPRLLLWAEGVSLLPARQKHFGLGVISQGLAERCSRANSIMRWNKESNDNSLLSPLPGSELPTEFRLFSNKLRNLNKKTNQRFWQKDLRMRKDRCGQERMQLMLLGSHRELSWLRKAKEPTEVNMLNAHRQLMRAARHCPRQRDSGANTNQPAKLPTTARSVLHPRYNRLSRTDLLFSIHPRSLVGDGKAAPGAGISGRLHM